MVVEKHSPDGRRAAGSWWVTGVTALVTLFVSAAPAHGQPPVERGVVEAGLLLRHLDGVKRVLMIGAHPDDEDTNLLTAIARGMGAEAAYLSITRGDGGQNLIGPELGEGLGVIRTGELEAARRIDGATQYFGRAFDYGYSKSADEAFSHWPREEALRDVVWVIRNFRPQVIVSVWAGNQNDGHGQHQAAGMLANEAFTAAGSPVRFRDLPGLGGVPWQASKLYHSARRNPPENTERISTGMLDPLLGKSYRQVSSDSRSQHRSQDMGAPQPLGPSSAGVVLYRTFAGDAPGLFSGIDTTLVEGLGDGRDSTIGIAMSRYRNALSRARMGLKVTSPSDAADDLAEMLFYAREALDAARETLDPQSVAIHDLERKVALTQKALLLASGVVFDVRLTDDLVVPGTEVRADIALWNAGPFEIEGASVKLERPGDSSSGLAGIEGDIDVASGAIQRWDVPFTLDPEAPLDEQYYLSAPRDGDLYRWPAEKPEVWGLPRNPAQFSGSVRFTLHASEDYPAPIDLTVPARYVGVDKAQGEFVKPVLVAPELSVAMQPAVMAWPEADRAPRTVSVVLRTERGDSRGELRLELPDGWTASPSSHAFELGDPGSSRGFEFEVRPGRGVTEGTHTIRAFAVTEEGERFDRRVDVIDYPHIERTLMFADAATQVSMFPVIVAQGMRVGYIMGSGDDGLVALQQMGVDAELVSDERVASGDFSGYDALVFGIRVYETRPDVAAVNDQILDFARRGGTVIVQYNKYEYPAGNYAPYPVSMGSRPVDRVTDPNSPVGFPNPDATVLHRPNRITLDDFDGWVQERGLYFLKEWDERYTPILELTDPNEPPKLGSTVVAPVGDGIYAYVALSFFRQFPAGVSGAYRLFANLVSLTADDWNQTASGGQQ